MQFNILVLSIFGAISVGAADIPSSAPSAAASSPEAMASQGISTRDQCLIGCGAGNTQCQAACDNLPNPTVEDVNKNTECVKKCNDEPNAASDPAKALSCVQTCNNEFHSSASASGASPSGSSKANSASGSDKNGSKKSSGANSKSGSNDNDASNAQTVFVSSSLAAFFGLAVAQL